MHNYFFICNIYLCREEQYYSRETLELFIWVAGWIFFFLFGCCLVLLFVWLFFLEDGGVGSYGGGWVLSFFLNQHQQQIYTYFCSFFFFFSLVLLGFFSLVLLVFCLTQNPCKFISYPSKLSMFSSVYHSIKVSCLSIKSNLLRKKTLKLLMKSEGETSKPLCDQIFNYFSFPLI